MVDKTRGGLAQDTRLTDFGHEFEVAEDCVEFFVFTDIMVISRISATNPYQLA